ncbi:ROK family transcriptional regulator [Kordiimonas sp.]|uniref:ROK family transcriptional regulator n=1 Tax=Kordiimonas sp. TaxID=1970157 RepID=UPI003A8D2A13
MVRKGSTQQSSAPYNRRIVLDIIRRRGAMSRKAIVEKVGLSPQTVANITQDLETIGLIVSRRDKSEKSRGQPPIAFDLNPQGGDAIGISLEPRRASAALVNLIGEVIDRREVEIDVADQTRTLAAMKRLVEDLTRSSLSGGRLWGIGVAMPGPFDATELSFVGPTAFEGWQDLSILDDLHRVTGLPVFYSVDSVAGALGESLFGVAKALDGFFYMHFGVGLGGTLVVDRAAYKGANSNATEIGHIPIVPGGRPCYCGNNGCLERYLSLHSLAETLGAPDAHALSATRIIELLERKDPVVINWCRNAAEHLRNAICIIENMLDPESIVIGGSAPKPLVEHILMAARPFHRSVRGGIADDSRRVLLSERQDDSSILGAAVLPIYKMLSPRFDVLLQDGKSELELAGMLGHKPTGGAGRL